MKRLAKKLPLYILLFLIFCSALLVPMRGGDASAAEEETAPHSIEETNVLDDLEGSILNGEKFNITEWGFDERRSPEIVSFVEYGYSFYSTHREDYGLYVYVYNPQGVAFDTDTDRNKIELQAGKTEILRYPLQFLNYSDRPGTEGMFYKFKVTLSENQKTAILNTLTQDGRAYRITQLELAVKGDLQRITCVTTYTYNGYAQGYGSELMTESSLACTTNGFEDYAELEVHQTVYRPEGDFHEGEQSQLNSCFFRVPEKYYENYGILSKIVCDWYEYVTKPIFVTENGDLYHFFDRLNGGNVPSANDGFGYMIKHITKENSYVWGLFKNYYGSIVTNCEEIDDSYTHGIYTLEKYLGKAEDYIRNPSNPYSAVFLSDNQSYTDFSATANEVEAAFRSMSEKLGGPYLGAFSETLFSDNIHSNRHRGYNHMEIAPEDPRTIFTNYTVKNLWQEYAGGYTLNTSFQTVNAIHEVVANDLTGSDDTIAEHLYIGKNDVANLKTEFSKAQSAKERLLLLRYADSKYCSVPVFSSFLDTKNIDKKEIDDELFSQLRDKEKTGEYDGFAAEETVYLDFKIISLNYTKNGVETVIPVVMTPQNVFSSVTPPLEVNFHTSSGLPWYIWLAIVLILIVLIVVLVLFFPILKPILGAVLKAIWWIITAPFRFIAWVIKKISEAVKKRREERAAAPKTEAPKAKNKGAPKPVAEAKAAKPAKTNTKKAVKK